MFEPIRTKAFQHQGREDEGVALGGREDSCGVWDHTLPLA